MKRTFKYLFILGFIICSAGWLFYFDNFAIDKTVRYRPLANGWVSAHADYFLQDDNSFLENLELSISSDLTHGRFRPAFFLYVSSPYILSPLVHQRSVSEEQRSYDKLVNGDLRLFSVILLSSILLSFGLMSLLIYAYTKEVLFSFLAIFFIPLSPSLTENLSQNYIDSQEIPLVLWICCWMFLFFISLKVEKPILKFGFLFLSSIFILLTFLTKETAIVLSVALIIVTISLFMAKNKERHEIGIFVTTSFIALIFSVILYYIVSFNKQGYSTNYELLNISSIIEAFRSLWRSFSRYSLNGIFGYIPIFLFAFIAIKERHKTLNGLPILKHINVILFMLLMCSGFLLILIPWQPILIKYLYPSVFFYAFAVAFSLSFISRWAKERFGKSGFLVYLFILPYAFLFNTIYAKASHDRDHWGVDIANYGVASVEKIAESIDQHIRKSHNTRQAVFVEYDTAFRWGKHVAWGKLHLMRILNLDMEINLVDRSGNNILNYKMPKAELSSFKTYADAKSLYVSNKKRDFESISFDVVYLGYKAGENPESEISSQLPNICYHLTPERIDWNSHAGFVPEFAMYKYVPRHCKGQDYRPFPTNISSF